MSICTRCNERPLDSNHARCKKCRAELYQERCKVPGYKEDLAIKNKEWRKNHKELTNRIIWNSNLKTKFGITIEQYEKMLQRQDGKCAICGRAETSRDAKGKIKRLAVDHCHKTGRNRELLCLRCNHAFERIDSIPDWCLKAMAYESRWL
jgi:Recombination endonuclease VII